MIVAIPSRGRATAMTSHKRIPSARVYVPAAEVGDYERANVANVVGVPNDVRGITPTRNWILDHADDARVVFIDDDVRSAGYLERVDRPGGQRGMKQRQIDEAGWLEIWRRLFELTEDLGLRLWGVSTISAPRAWYPYKPLLFNSYVLASCMGLVNDGRTRFDESFVVKEDYELCLRCMVEDGGVVCARFCFWENEHWTGAGGCADYRSQAIEADCTKRLMMKYPGAIRRVTRGGTRWSVELV